MPSASTSSLCGLATNQSQCCNEQPTTPQYSGREWWKIAISKVLNGENGVRKTGANPNSSHGPRSQRTSDSKQVEYRTLYEEFGKLKKVLDITRGDYEDSKRYEIFRRYNLLKGIIKRTVMYTKLEVLPDISHALGIGALPTMTAPGIRKPLGSQVPECPKSELNERIHLLKKRVSFIREQIQSLDESYEQSKQYIPFQRYRLMKAMIKQLLTNCIDLQYNQ